MKQRHVYQLAAGPMESYATSALQFLNPLTGIEDLKKSGVRYEVSDFIGRIIPKGANKISRSKGNPIKGVYLGTISGATPIFLFMDMDTAYLVKTTVNGEVESAEPYKGYNPFRGIDPSDSFVADSTFTTISNSLYQIPLTKAMYEFVIHGGRYISLSNPNGGNYITPTICKRKNLEDPSVLSYKLLGNPLPDYTYPFVEYVNGKFARITQIVDDRKVSIEEHDMKSDSELRWITNFKWPNLDACISTLFRYELIRDYQPISDLTVSNCDNTDVFNVCARNKHQKTFIYERSTGHMTLIL